ncbi:hypothetical protein CAL29_11575 [Bordetella genomosp. 10]|uniref:HTH lysR-type domain-containing protein n=1 Tax=Bordetella genomosp. 10 TaxID=1416804 RepID=A0A261SBM7_9BORD|nr:LysR family transcriptional regulator [Bordetella genomosp. 10]OZI34180.1 hypothetical protein CAL29_11575 [Bordetella genomosp. 10]
MMIDTLNLDQLRVFTAIAEHGSFTAAARQLRRAQSAVSNAIVNLETALGVALFDRGGWKPVLTEHGRALLIDAAAVLARVDQLKSRAHGLTQGLEAELAVVLDVMFPAQQLVALAAEFRQTFPGVALHLHVDALGGVPQRVLSGECDWGVQGTLPDIAPELAAHAMPEVAVTPVASPAHALAALRGITVAQLREHTQIVLTDRSAGTEGRTFSVFSEDQVLTTDLGAKRAMLCAGLGWGFMPHSFVEDDLHLGRLCELALVERTARNRSMPLFAIHRRNAALGPAGQWMLNWFLESGDR